ncbi:hypothetical protein [Sphingobacterium hotanense]|uniref:hypothetical protein n=1 Tax=Sphingobacterium hotanense TaxID=649196 RepID=UPI0021A85B80|nr:hypothetical protein [Sphingobacterium hotanense]MCT1525732.1 hypothetical protein [Sphingobacterium hotanense]
MGNKKKKLEDYRQGIQTNKRLSDPNKAFLNHVHNQANKMAELLGEKQGEQYIKDAIKEWPHLIKSELEIFSKRKA